jgi:hypothetical protein
MSCSFRDLNDGSSSRCLVTECYSETDLFVGYKQADSGHDRCVAAVGLLTKPVCLLTISRVISAVWIQNNSPFKTWHMNAHISFYLYSSQKGGFCLALL